MPPTRVALPIFCFAQFINASTITRRWRPPMPPTKTSRQLGNRFGLEFALVRSYPLHLRPIVLTLQERPAARYRGFPCFLCQGIPRCDRAEDRRGGGY